MLRTSLKLIELNPYDPACYHTLALAQETLQHY
jgi:hypothetical protein